MRRHKLFEFRREGFALFCAALGLMTGRLEGQVSEEWVARYGGPLYSDDSPTGLATDTNGNVYVTGISYGIETSVDYLTIKYDPEGRILWTARYDGPYHAPDYPQDIAVDPEGNVYVTGQTYVALYLRYATIKYDSEGNELWVAIYNSGGMQDRATALAVDAEGNVYVTGASYNAKENEDYVTVKYDRNGVGLWVKRFDGTGERHDEPTAIALDGSGNIYITGWSEGEQVTSLDYATVKYDPEGNEIWVARYNGPGNSSDAARDIAVDGEGNVYVTGESGMGAFAWDYATIKYSVNGDSLWVRQYDGPGNMDDLAVALELDAAGNVIVTGRSDSGLNEDYATVKYDLDGNLLWVSRYAGPGNGQDRAVGVAIDEIGNVYVGGWSYGGISSYYDYTTVKYDPEGEFQWEARYAGPGDAYEELVALALDAGGNIVVTGRSDGGVNSANDRITVKYDSEGAQQWAARYITPGDGEDYAAALEVDASGEVAVTGWSYLESSSHDYVTIRYDELGRELWEARYNGPGNGVDLAFAVGQDGSGRVAVTGKSQGTATGADYATIQYDAQGAERWVTRYDGPGSGDDEAAALAIDGAGNIYVTGSSMGNGTSLDYATLLYDSEGDSQWVARYEGGTSQADRAYALALGGDGNVYITGTSYGDSTQDFATIAYDGEGNELWVARYDGPDGGEDQALALAVDGEGNVLVAGWSDGVGSSQDFATIKYDAAGNELWAARYDGPAGGFDAAQVLGVDGEGRVYVTGPSEGEGTSSDFATIAYDSEGNELWVARYDGGVSGYDASWSLAVDGNGGIYVAGQSFGSGLTGDYVIVKYDASGTELWVARYDGPGDGEGPPDDNPAALALDGTGGVYVTGQAIGVGTAGDYTTIKYQQELVGIAGDRGFDLPLPKSFLLAQNYPNPFNPSTVIAYDLPEGSEEGVPVLLEVFNVRGQRVATLVNEVKRPGKYSVAWNGREGNGRALGSGIYIYRLRAGFFSTTRKMMLLK